MARGVNKVILVGNLGSDPEVRYLPSGGAVANLSIATSESWRDKNSGEQQERTEWHRVVLFNRLGEIAGEYLKKGSKVYIEGKIQTKKWQDNNGQDRYSTEIVANEMQMLDSRGGPSDFSGPSQGAPANRPQNQGGGGGYQQPQQQPPSSQQQSQRQQPPAQQQQTPEPNNNGFDDFDDDIPF